MLQIWTESIKGAFFILSKKAVQLICPTLHFWKPI